MNCSTIQKTLSAYVDRQLPAWENTEVFRHTQQCGDCESELQSLLQLKRTLRAGTLPPMPESIRAAILAETVQKANRREAWFSIRWWVPTVALATAASGWLALQAAEHYVFNRTPDTLMALHKPRKVTGGHDVAWHREPKDAASNQPH